MAEEQKSEQTAGAEPQKNKPEGKAPAGDEPKFTQAELDEILNKRLARERKKSEELAQKYADYEELKKRLAQFEAEAEQKRLAELSEAERLKEQLQALQQERDNIARQLEEEAKARKQQAVLTAFTEQASKHGIFYVEAARKLADLSAVEFDENGQPVGVEELIKELVKENPFLLGERKEPRTIGDSVAPNERPDKTKEQRLKEAYEKAKSGRDKDKIAYARLKAELGLLS